MGDAREVVLGFEEVSKVYKPGEPGEVVVFSALDLQVREGEVVGLIAPSGAGKSTLLNLAGLLDRPSGGRIWLMGEEVGGLDDRARTILRRDALGFVFQFHHLLAEFSALENVMVPLLGAGMGRGRARARAVELLERIGLGERLDHRPDALSGGEQQRVAICRALANMPKLLLADEPTGNLDPDNAGLVFDLFVELARDQGLAALVATHNLELATRMDRVVDLREL